MNDNKGQTNKQENASDAQPCCDGGSCCPSDSDGSGKCWKMVVFFLIVIAAGVVLARSFISKSNSDSTQSQQAFASIQPDSISDNTSSLKAKENAEMSVESEIKMETPAAVDESKKQDNSAKAASPLWKADLDSLASLNKVATEVDAVFVLLAARDQLNNQAITKEIESAAQKIISDGSKVSVFRLKESAPDYAQLAKQVSVPGVIAMVKGRGMSTVSGEITEAKLVQAFVAASRPTSGCCPSGAGASGCP